MTSSVSSFALDARKPSLTSTVRLMDQQSYLEHTVLATTNPLFETPANKRQGEIFPTIWYTTHIELTSIQQSLMARSVLVSENPYLK